MTNEDTPYLSKDGENSEFSTGLSKFSLQIQLASTAVATSFLLIFIPNVETISFMAFFLGYMFSVSFAFSTIFLMSVSWELLAMITFGFSGIVFPFKIIAWCLIGLLGNFARKSHTKYFFEFMAYGIFSALIYDILVTIPMSFLFLGQKERFLAVLLSNLLIGILFTSSHIISNAILFSLNPRVYLSVIPLLSNHYPDLIQISDERFAYLYDHNWDVLFDPQIIKQNKRRVVRTMLTSILILLTLGASIAVIINPQILEDRSKNQNGDEITVTFQIHYHDVLPDESHSLTVFTNQTVLMILQTIAIIHLSPKYSVPYVDAINNVWENVNLTRYSWTYYVDGSYVYNGAATKYLVQGNVVLWDYRYI